MNANDKLPVDRARRSLAKAALYVTPAVLSLKVTPAFAMYGSGDPARPIEDSTTDGLQSLFAAWLK
jgi:hypothetical protein